MVIITSPVPVPNIFRWEAIAADLAGGRISIRLYYGSLTRFQDFLCLLSDTAAGCTGIALNSSPQGPSDTFVTRGPGGPVGSGMGAASSLTNAIAAYRGAGSHAAGLKALELRGVTDGWLDAALAGT
jgi:hypothetical protein